MSNLDPVPEEMDDGAPLNGHAPDDRSSAGQSFSLWSLIDRSVRSGDGEVLGRVSDVVVERGGGRVAYVEVALLEEVAMETFASKQISLAVPWEALRLDEGAGVDGDEGPLVLSVPVGDLDPVPGAGAGGPGDPDRDPDVGAGGLTDSSGVSLPPPPPAAAAG